MDAVGIIFSNIHDEDLAELTAARTTASIPFLGRYRLIDFALSNMVNSGMTKVGVITKSNYQSLMDHVGSGKDWDLARRHGGLIILPPFGVKESTSLYNTRFEALQTATGFLAKSTEEYVILSDSDFICNMDYSDLLDLHEKKQADLTMVYFVNKADKVSGQNNVIIEFDKDGRATDMVIDPDDIKKGVNIYANICVMRKQLLLNLISEAASRGKRHFSRDILMANVHQLKIYGFEHKGYFEKISSLQSYYDQSMKLLEREARDSLFKKGGVYTKVKDSTPTRYGSEAVVKNSLIADGCEIDGEVYDSIIFRGARIAKGTVIKNSILMQGAIVGRNALVNCIITDKNVVIKDRRELSGCSTHPFFVRKGSVL